MIVVFTFPLITWFALIENLVKSKNCGNNKNATLFRGKKATLVCTVYSVSLLLVVSFGAIVSRDHSLLCQSCSPK